MNDEINMNKKTDIIVMPQIDLYRIFVFVVFEMWFNQTVS